MTKKAPPRRADEDLAVALEDLAARVRRQAPIDFEWRTNADTVDVPFGDYEIRREAIAHTITVHITWPVA